MKKGIYKDKNGKWYIHTSIKGKTCTIRGFNSKTEADENYDTAIEKWKRKHNIVVNDDEYNKVLNEYISYRSKVVRKASLEKDITQSKYYSVIFSGNNLKQIYNELRLKIIYQDILDNDKLTNQKKMRLVLSFREFSKFCYLSQYIPQDTYNMVLMVFLPIKENKQDRKIKRYIPQSHFKALLSEINKVNDNLFSLAIFVLYSCGLRISELLGLLVGDVDLENRKINVRRQLQTNGELTTTLKTSNSYRQVPINKELYGVMLDKKGENVQDRLFPYSHSSFKRKLKEYEEKANIPLYSCHEYRESFCTNLAMKISNMSEVSYCAKVSGHTTSMFLNTYVKSMNDELENKFF